MLQADDDQMENNEYTNHWTEGETHGYQNTGNKLNACLSAYRKQKKELEAPGKWSC
jgi:hypothetical protein